MLSLPGDRFHLWAESGQALSKRATQAEDGRKLFFHQSAATERAFYDLEVGDVVQCEAIADRLTGPHAIKVRKADYNLPCLAWRHIGTWRSQSRGVGVDET